jgi:hypothetical protein
MLTTFWYGVLKRRNCLGILGVGGIIMQLFIEKECTGFAGIQSNCFGESLTLSRIYSVKIQFVPLRKYITSPRQTSTD